jgi:peptidoglycan hydrolase-like protein with peptidoglycan-binding domain
MPHVTTTITTTSTDVPVETIRTLQSELANVGLAVAGGDTGDTPTFGEATSARAKNFQERYRLPVTGSVDPATGNILSLSALVATETDRSKLRAALESAVNVVPNSPDYNYWLARYAILAGDYGLAARVSPKLKDLSRIRTDLGAITDGLASPVPRAP